jgi:hypothetical protein
MGRADLDELRTVAMNAFAMMEMETAFAPIGELHVQVEFPDDFASRRQQVSRLCGGQAGGDQLALGWTCSNPKNPSLQYILINSGRFAAMAEVERLVTIAHEMGHAHIGVRRTGTVPSTPNPIWPIDEYRASMLAVRAALPQTRAVTSSDFSIWLAANLDSYAEIDGWWGVSPDLWYKDAAAILQQAPLRGRIAAYMPGLALWPACISAISESFNPNFLEDVDADDRTMTAVISSFCKEFAVLGKKKNPF